MIYRFSLTFLVAVFMYSMAKELSRKSFLTKAGIFTAGVTGAGFGLSAHLSVEDYNSDGKKKYLNNISPINPSNENPPNIIYIMADDMGFGDISPMGNQIIHTPNLQKMADEGVVMDNFYASAPVCSPSRAGLLTGRYPIRTRVTDALLYDRSFMGIGHRLLGYTQYGIPEDEILVSEVLQKRGYQTGIIGKWHLGDRKEYHPNNRGFDFFYGPLRSNDIPPFDIYRNQKIEIPHPANQENLTKNYTKEAVRFIKRNKSKPFFLYIPHTFPHIPLHASDPFRNKSKAGRYGDTIEELDWSIGEIFHTLKKYNLDKKTLVVFTSDNGPWYQGSPGNLRGRKRHVFDGGFRVPLIARWKGILPEGKTSHAMSMNFDLFSTALTLGGVELPQDRIIDGKNMIPVLKAAQKAKDKIDPEETSKLHKDLYFYWRKKLWAMRHKNYKYHRLHEVGDINPNPWPHNTKKGPYMFDLSTDPSENYNLMDQKPQVARQLSEKMKQFEKSVNDNIRGWF